MNQLSTDALLTLIDNAAAKLIDCREVDAYNGWCLRQEKRGGHLPGAISLPAKWTNYIDWLEIVQAKAIVPNQEIVIYGYDQPSIEKVANQFTQAGYNQVSVYLHFLDEWCQEDSLPMNRLAKYRHLVSAKWLNQLLTTGQAPEYENNKVVLVHAHYQNREAYDRGHIPGAIELDSNNLESPETWNRRSPQELKQALENLGITKDTTVILYGRFDYPDNHDPFPGSSAGHLGAIRCALIMLYAGVKDVRVLNGGLQAWQDEGFHEVTEETPKVAGADFGATIPGQPDLIVDIEEAKAMIAADDKNLVSVRSWSEYIGEVSGYHYIKKKGRIPGSVFGNCGSDAYHMENYRNLDHTTRDYHEIEALWAEAGITPDKHNAFYCGTGWRGSEAFFNAWLMGWPRVSVFDGGWFEWSNDDNNPIETGVPEQASMIDKGVLVK